jgi:hypothetical protein
MRTLTMHGKTIVFFLAVAFSHATGAGEIYRCTAANGDVMFTNLVCPAKSQVQHVASYEPVPDSPVQTADAAAQSAAMSARQAQEAAEQAQAAAYQSAQAAHRQTEYEAESDQASYDNNGYPLWIAPYAFFGSRFARHDGHHHRHVVVGSGPSMPPHRPAPPTKVNLVAHQR